MSCSELPPTYLPTWSSKNPHVHYSLGRIVVGSSDPEYSRTIPMSGYDSLRCECTILGDFEFGVDVSVTFELQRSNDGKEWVTATGSSPDVQVVAEGGYFLLAPVLGVASHFMRVKLTSTLFPIIVMMGANLTKS